MELLMWSTDYRSISQQVKKQNVQLDGLILNPLSVPDSEKKLFIEMIKKAPSKVQHNSQSVANSWY